MFHLCDNNFRLSWSSSLFHAQLRRGCLSSIFFRTYSVFGISFEFSISFISSSCAIVTSCFHSNLRRRRDFSKGLFHCLQAQCLSKGLCGKYDRYLESKAKCAEPSSYLKFPSVRIARLLVFFIFHFSCFIKLCSPSNSRGPSGWLYILRLYLCSQLLTPQSQCPKAWDRKFMREVGWAARSSL